MGSGKVTFSSPQKPLSSPIARSGRGPGTPPCQSKESRSCGVRSCGPVLLTVCSLPLEQSPQPGHSSWHSGPPAISPVCLLPLSNADFSTCAGSWAALIRAQSGPCHASLPCLWQGWPSCLKLHYLKAQWQCPHPVLPAFSVHPASISECSSVPELGAGTMSFTFRARVVGWL